MHEEFLDPHTLRWSDGVFPLGGDSLALSRFVTLRRGWKVCDLGTGSGALLLLLHGREPSLALSGVEIDPISAQTARDNLSRNGLEGTILNEDLRRCSFPAGQFDLVISNPPYFSEGDDPKRCEISCSLPELCAAASRLLRNGGRFALCHRPERLVDLMCALRQYDLEPKRLKLLAHSPSHPPFLVLVECIRQGKSGLEIII